MNVHQQFAKFFNDENIYPFAYLLSKRLSEGSISINIRDVEQGVFDDELDDIKIGIPIKSDISISPFVSSSNDKILPFKLFQDNLYINRYFEYESSIINVIKNFVEKGKQSFENRKNALDGRKEFLKKLYSVNDDPKASRDEQTDWQFASTILSYLNNFSIITGGPGTGKTTTVAKILAILYDENPELKVALTAPTGKAAMRMKESLKNNPLTLEYGINDKIKNLQEFTIHRLLGYIHGSPFFKHNETNYLNYDVVVVDEVSMVDIALFYKLICAVNPESKIILLGDKNQLSSVEAGSLLADLCNSQERLNVLSNDVFKTINLLIENNKSQISVDYKVDIKSELLFNHIIELKKSHRFNVSSGIGQLSIAIINSDEQKVIDILSKKDNPNIVFDSKYDDTVFHNFIKGYDNYIKEEDTKKALEIINNLRVLCVVREGERGIYAVNRKIEAYLKKRNLIRLNDEFYIHRPIIITKNYRDLGLYNGDIGIIRM